MLTACSTIFNWLVCGVLLLFCERQATSRPGSGKDGEAVVAADADGREWCEWLTSAGILDQKRDPQRAEAAEREWHDQVRCHEEQRPS